MGFLIDPEINERVHRLDLPFNRYGLDPFGIDREHLARFYTLLSYLYRYYHKVTSFDIEHVPDSGRALLIGNHSGGLPLDAGMIIASLMLDKDPPRHAHAMVEYFAQKLPFVSQLFSRVGHLTGLPEHAARFLNNDRMVLAFPEGARGTGKLYKDRYKLVRFGTGFMRLALQTQSPIVPLAFIGGEEAIPTQFHLKRLAKILGVPYVPVPPQILPLPLPVSCQIYYGKPLLFEGDGNESDEVIHDYVDQVKDAIAALIERGLAARDSPFQLTRVTQG